MKKINLFIILAFLIVLVSFLLICQKKSQTTPQIKPGTGQEKESKSNLQTITINGQEIRVEIAKTPEKRVQGLSHRESLPEKQGMLFVFEKPGLHQFWMKDTLIPLDFVWLANGQVVEVTENVRPQDYQPPKSFEPQQPVDQVLELPAGTVEKLGIEPGHSVILERSEVE